MIDEAGADALRFALIHGATPGQRPAVRAGQARERPQLREQALERDAVRARRPAGVDPRRRRAARAGSRARSARPSAGSCRGRRRRRPTSTGRSPTTSSARSPGSSTTRSGREFCDWGLELAKVRLADDVAAGRATREATWWTLVEVLDTYLRLLHPVMPFVTEALWGALPHAAGDPELLIVARWPAAGDARRRRPRPRSGALVELVRAIRNARARRRSSPPSWLPVRLAVPPSLRPGVRGAAPGGRAAGPGAAAGGRERTPRRSPPATRAARWPSSRRRARGARRARPARAARRRPDADRARLEKELAEAEGCLAAARARLANEAFTSKAPPAVVEGARAREAELADQVERLRRASGRSQTSRQSCPGPPA